MWGVIYSKYAMLAADPAAVVSCPNVMQQPIKGITC